MAGKALRERIQQDLAVWFADGIIDQQTLEVLRERYDARKFGWIGVVKYIGIVGGLFALFGIFGMIAAMAESELLAAILLGGLGGAITYWGLRLAGDIRNRYATSSKVILTLGTIMWVSAVGIFCNLTGMEEESILLVTGAVCFPVTFYLAYRSRNTYLLLASLIALFHWIGSWNEMWGRSTYAFSVQDPKAMTVFALAAIGVGIHHERHLYPKTGRFYLIWETLGLLYLNMSLLILSIWREHGSTLPYILVFTAATVAQIFAGASMQNRLIRNFGVTFFVINVFTRYHEFFWSRWHIGSFLFVGGLLAVGIGVGTEVAVRVLRGKGGPT